MAQSYTITNNRLIFRNNREDCINEKEKQYISGFFTEIVFPECFDELYDDDFDACRDQLAKVTKLDFSKAKNLKIIGDDTFTGAKSLKVVVLPKNKKIINEFKDCPLLREIHINYLSYLQAITNDRDKRLSVFASKVSQSIDVNDLEIKDFLADVGILYVPSDMVSKLKRTLEGYDETIDIRPLPEGYSFPDVALSEPWFNFRQAYGNPMYHCVLIGQSFGPVTIKQLANMVLFGIVNSSTLVWKDGMSNWAPASDLVELQKIL